MKLSIEDAAKVVDGILVGPSGVEFSGATANSREVSEGNLFVALPGNHLDGHAFVADAFLRGACAAMVERELPGSGPQIVVENTARALSRLASWSRDVVDPVVIGVTGSTGKTSTKDLLASICSRKFLTVASKGSYNTEVGVPLTLLAINRQTEMVVCEMGARGPGQIAELCAIARPHVGIVTNVGVTHYEQFGSRDAIAAAKAELVEALPEGGSAVLNGDDPLVEAMKSQTKATVTTFGSAHTADVRVESPRFDAHGRPTFRIVRGREGIWVSLQMSGRHQLINAAAAAAAALALSIPLDDCRAGLESARSSPWRMEVRSAGGVVVINDAYNANPMSVASALDTASAMVTSGGRLIAVLGYMAELGEIAPAEHRKVGELAASLAARLIVVSDRAADIAQGALRSGMTDVAVAQGGDEVLELLGDLEAGDVILVKGSRAAGLEDLAEQIRVKAAAG